MTVLKKAPPKRPAPPQRKYRVKPVEMPVLDADKAAAELCKRDFKFFVREFWDVIIAETMEWGPHMDVMCEEAEYVFRKLFMRYEVNAQGELVQVGRTPKEHDLVINVPPGTSKSTIISVMLPVWGWINDPTLRYITGSYSGTVSTELATKSRDIIRSPKFQLYFPELQIKKDQDGKKHYKTTRGGERLATSVTGTSTSFHAHAIIIDDPHNPKQAASAVQVQQANVWLDTTLSTRKVDKKVTVMILIMQRLASEDATGHLTGKKKTNLRWVVMPATISKLVRPASLRDIYVNGLLDPLRMPRDVLADMKIDLGSNGYAGQMDQSPVPAGGGIWKRWFVEVPDEQMPDRRLMSRFGTHWDLAYTEKEENSASAYVSGGRINERIYIDDLGWDWLEFPALIEWMKTKQGPHYIEAKASGKSAKQTLTKHGVTAIEVQVFGGDKVARANMATPIAEAGAVYIRKSLLDRLYNDAKQGILLFPKAAHTDLADALAQLLQFLDNRAEIKSAKSNEGSWLDEEPDYLNL